MSRPVDEVRIPIAREELRVTTEQYPRERVRVHTRVTETEEEVELLEAREDVEVERVPVGRIVAARPEVRIEGDTTIVPILEEVVVVERRLLLKEEIRITKRRLEQSRHVRVPLRTEHVDIERELSREELQRRKT